MGVTYKAFDVDLRCPAALKVISLRSLNLGLCEQLSGDVRALCRKRGFYHQDEKGERDPNRGEEDTPVQEAF